MILKTTRPPFGGGKFADRQPVWAAAGTLAPATMTKAAMPPIVHDNFNMTASVAANTAVHLASGLIPGGRGLCRSGILRLILVRAYFCVAQRESPALPDMDRSGRRGL